MDNEPTLEHILAGKTFDQEVTGAGKTIKFEVGDTMIATFQNLGERKSDLNDNMQKVYTFVLATAGTFSQGPQSDTKRVDFEAGDEVTLYGKGNLNYLMGSVKLGELVKVVREKDEKLEGRPKGKDMSSAWRVFKAS